MCTYLFPCAYAQMQADEVYCKIRAPLDRLRREADRINMKFKLNPDKLGALCKAGRMDGQTVGSRQSVSQVD